jgi:MoxR-like ATPase
MEGTYPLPEAQVDRFFFKLKITYPSAEELGEILDKTTEEAEPELQPVVAADTILEMKRLVRQVPVAEHVKAYAIRLVLASHPDDSLAVARARQYVRIGASPRGVQSLILGAKVAALFDGRYNASLEDVQAVALPALRHRLLLNLRGEAEGVDADAVVNDLVRGVPTRPRA